jgi:hypothetical protein
MSDPRETEPASTSPDPSPGPRAAGAKAWLAALSLVLVGGVAGVALDRLVLLHAPEPTAAGLHDVALTSLMDHLDLDGTQRRQVDSILAAHHTTLRQTWATLHAHLGESVDSAHRDLEAVLTPAQREAFREWLTEMSGPSRH